MAKRRKFIYGETLVLAGKEVEVEYYKAHGRTSSVAFRKGKLVVSFSKFLKDSEVQKTKTKFLNWGLKRLKKGSWSLSLPRYKDGEVIHTHNKSYLLNVNFENRKNISAKLLNSSEIIVCFPEKKYLKAEIKKKLKDKVDFLIMKDQFNYLKDVVSEINQLYFGQKFNDLRFKRVDSRYGSCSSKRNINIAYKLLYAPREVFRYVCVHELAHLIEFNHSKAFWKLVEEAMPDYKNQEIWLKENGFLLG